MASNNVNVNECLEAACEALETVNECLDEIRKVLNEHQAAIDEHDQRVERLVAERDHALDVAESVRTELRRFGCPGVKRVEQERRDGTTYVLPLLAIYPSPEGLIIRVG